MQTLLQVEDYNTRPDHNMRERIHNGAGDIFTAGVNFSCHYEFALSDLSPGDFYCDKDNHSITQQRLWLVWRWSPCFRRLIIIGAVAVANII